LLGETTERNTNLVYDKICTQLSTHTHTHTHTHTYTKQFRRRRTEYSFQMLDKCTKGYRKTNHSTEYQRKSKMENVAFIKSMIT
jgi:hypothetical protein